MGYLPQGDIASDLVNTLSSAGIAATKIAEDPHLPEVTCQVLRLNAIEKGQKPGPACARVPKAAGVGRGIGLRYAAGPLSVFVKTREKPWLIPVVVGSLIGGVFLLGYMAGAGGKR